MRLDELKKRYDKHHLQEQQFILAKDILNKLYEMTKGHVDDASTNDIDQLISAISNIEKEHFYALMRYFHMIHRMDIYIRLTQYTGMIGVMESILARLEKVKGKDVLCDVLKEFTLPKLGTSPEKLPLYTEQLMSILKEATQDESDIERILSGNNHQIPDEVFYEEKVAYESSLSLTEYLTKYHQRQIEILKKHAATHEPWFEQEINNDVVNYVLCNQEVQGGIFKDGFVYETKIPYNIIKWLEAKTPLEKRYYACHCPFARENILSDKHKIDALWCHCSGGFAKRKYEVIFGQSLQAIPLENALKGDAFCRFAIDLRHIPHLK